MWKILCFLLIVISIVVSIPLNGEAIKAVNRFHDMIPFTGGLTPNHLLENATYIAHNKIRGPETTVFSNDGLLYAGLMNGQIVQIDPETNDVKIIAHMGNEINETICNETMGLIAYGRESCGLPLGIRFHPDHPDMLYIADAFLGIIKVDVKKGTKEIVLHANDTRFGDKPMKYADDLDIDGDMIYFVDLSHKYAYNEVMIDFVRALPYGRVFAYNETNDRLELINDKLYLPNGIQLTPDKTELIISEPTRARLVKIPLYGDKKGTVEIFAELPGFGDTLRLTENNTLIVPFFRVRKAGIPSIHDFIDENPIVQSLLYKDENVKILSDAFDKDSLKYGLVAEYDLNGTVLRSWHDTTGERIECVTNANIYKNKMYLGSYYNTFIGVIDL